MNNHNLQSQLVLDAIAQGAKSFSEVARSSNGMYPFELSQLINDLIKQGFVTESQSGYSINTIEKRFCNNCDSEESIHRPVPLPEPHPDDYDWRFNASTSHRLAELLTKQNFMDNAILLLGAPSVLVEIACISSTARTILIDKNAELINWLSRFPLPRSCTLLKHDCLSGNLWHTDESVDVVLCDPPWYIEHYVAFLLQATYVCRIGSMIAISLLPMNTRPNAVDDRWQIFEIARKLGLHLQLIEPSIIRYQTPIFEYTSLQEASINITDDWRSSDLAIFRKTIEPNPLIIENLMRSIAKIESQEWAEILLGSYKIKLRGPFNDSIKLPKLISIESNNILPTVSRRYSNREIVDLWLWDNRVFAVEGKVAFLTALYTLAGRAVPQSLPPVSKSNLELAVAQLRNILLLNLDKVTNI